jgi:hypothetical protein
MPKNTLQPTDKDFSGCGGRFRHPQVGLAHSRAAPLEFGLLLKRKDVL